MATRNSARQTIKNSKYYKQEEIKRAQRRNALIEQEKEKENRIKQLAENYKEENKKRIENFNEQVRLGIAQQKKYNNVINEIRKRYRFKRYSFKNIFGL
jgi:hypothetical protein